MKLMVVNIYNCKETLDRGIAMYAECHDCNKLISEKGIYFQYIYGSLDVFCQDCYLKHKREG